MSATKVRTGRILATLLSFTLYTAAVAQQEAPQADKDFVSNLLEQALITEVKGKKFEQGAKERHKEVIKNPVKDIVTYWRSEVAGKGEFVTPEKQLKVKVTKMVRAGGTLTVHATATAPAKGEASGKVLTDDGEQLASASSPFTTTVEVTAECVLKRVMENGETKVQIEIKAGQAKVKGTKFQNGLVDKVRGPIEDALNRKLDQAAEPLRKTANAALKKAYDDGKLKIDQ